MKIISFAWTTPALLAGHKTVTRRDWDPDYARRFQPGERVQAFDRSPRHKGECVAIIQLTSITYEPPSLAPDSDYEAEGFAYLAEWPELLPKTGPFSDVRRIYPEAFERWRRTSQRSEWVVRFKLVNLTNLGIQLRGRLPEVRPL